MNVYKKNEQDDIALLNIAKKRMKIFEPSTLISQAEIDTEFGFTPESLAEVGEIEFEQVIRKNTESAGISAGTLFIIHGSLAP